MIRCSLLGHQWGVIHRTGSGLYAPRICCLRCGTEPHQPITARGVALGLVPVLCVMAAVLMVVLSVGG